MVRLRVGRLDSLSSTTVCVVWHQLQPDILQSCETYEVSGDIDRKWHLQVDLVDCELRPHQSASDSSRDAGVRARMIAVQGEGSEAAELLQDADYFSLDSIAASGFSLASAEGEMVFTDASAEVGTACERDRDVRHLALIQEGSLASQIQRENNDLKDFW